MAHSNEAERSGTERTERGLQNVDLRKALERRCAALGQVRAPWDLMQNEVGRYVNPATTRWMTYSDRNGNNGLNSTGIKTNNSLMDARAIRAREVLANGMHSGLTSPATPWFNITVKDPDLADWWEVKVWLEQVKAEIYSLMARSNFYNVCHAGYRDLAGHGVEAAVMLEHTRRGAVCHGLQYGEYWLGSGDDGGVDTLYRRYLPTVAQLISSFGKANVTAAVRRDYDKGDYDTVHACFHAIEPNHLRKEGVQSGPNKEWRSVYWQQNVDAVDGKGKLLAHEGFDERPFWAPRWLTAGNEIWPVIWPGLNALPEMRQLSLEQLRRQQLKDYGVKPALQGPASLSRAARNMVPGGLTSYADGMGGDGFRPIWEPNANFLSPMREDIQDRHDAIDMAYYADLFLAMINRRGVQPLTTDELARRYTEQLHQLGPVVDRVMNEKLRTAVERAYDILRRTGVLPIPPQELDGAELEIEFIGALAQAQRSAGVNEIEGFMGFAGNLAGIAPEVRYKVDFEQSIDEYGRRKGVPARMIRSDEQVKEMKEAEAEQKQMEQMMAAAGPVKEGVEAASLLSELGQQGQQQAPMGGM